MTKEIKVGDPATICYVNDRYPATVIAVSPSGREITVQMRGVSNNKLVWPEQEYDTFEDPEGSVSIFSLRKSGRYVERGASTSPILSIGTARYYQCPEI